MKRKLSLILSLIILLAANYSDAQTFNCFIANDRIVSSNEFQFDVYIQSTSTEFSMRTLQGCFTFNPQFIPAGATVTPYLTERSSELKSYSPGTLIWSPAGNGFEVSANTGVDCTNGTIISSSNPVRVGTFKLVITNGLKFNCTASNPNMVRTGDPTPSGLPLKMAITRWNSLDCTGGNANTIISKNGTYTQFISQTAYDRVNNMRPSIDVQPVTSNICPKGTAVFTVNATATSSDPVNYRWLENGVPVADGNGTSGNYQGAATSVLKVSAPSAELNGKQYSCEVSQCNTRKSEVAALNIKGPVEASLLGNDVTLAKATPLILDAGSGYSSYHWSNNAITQTIVVNTPGTYSVFVSDAEGCVKTDGIEVRMAGTSVAENNQSDITLYPNPVRNILNVIQGSENIKGVEITNSVGQIQKIQYTLVRDGGKLELNVSALSAGIYFIELRTENQKIVKKFVKE